MNPFEVKVFMLKNGLTIASIARDFCASEPGVKFTSMQTMLSDVIYGRKWLPEYARKLDEEYGIKLERPERQTNREIVKQAA